MPLPSVTGKKLRTPRAIPLYVFKARKDEDGMPVAPKRKKQNGADVEVPDQTA